MDRIHGTLSMFERAGVMVAAEAPHVETAEAPHEPCSLESPSTRSTLRRISSRSCVTGQQIAQGPA
jgi:hypothetical protein